MQRLLSTIQLTQFAHNKVRYHFSIQSLHNRLFFSCSIKRLITKGFFREHKTDINKVQGLVWWKRKSFAVAISCRFSVQRSWTSSRTCQMIRSCCSGSRCCGSFPESWMDQRWPCHQPRRPLRARLRCLPAISDRRWRSRLPRCCNLGPCSTSPVADSRSWTMQRVPRTSFRSAGSTAAGNSSTDCRRQAAHCRYAPRWLPLARWWTHQSLANRSLYTNNASLWITTLHTNIK